MKRGATVRVTRNFERNLDAIEAFLVERDAPAAFGDLLTELFDTLIPALQRFPGLGADLLERQTGSVEGLARVGSLRERLGPEASLRQYVVGDYIVLYASMDRRVHLLAIKHHRQLSFDLRGHWIP